MPWSNEGSSVWNATRCAPLDPNADQVGTPCMVEGSGQSGIDTCDISQICFEADADDNGTCVGFCGGTPDAPVCPEGQACFISNEDTLALCLPTCDPLLPTCPEGNGCFPTLGEDAFVCIPAPSNNIDSPWTCHATGGCEPGTLCVDSSALPDCDDTMCCTPYCDVDSPVCPIDTECLPFWDKNEAPPEFANLGVCGSA